MDRVKRILIVDDADDIGSLVVELLESEGYRVSFAPDGKAALDLLRSATDLPDLILLDLMMPRMDGFAFRVEQQKDARLSAIPVLVMTAAADAQGKTAALGAHGFVKKPFKDIETLLDTVAQFF